LSVTMRSVKCKMGLLKSFSESPKSTNRVLEIMAEHLTIHEEIHEKFD